MDYAEKLESLLALICHDVYQIISAELDQVDHYLDSGKLSGQTRELFQFATRNQGALLKPVINAAAMCDVFSVLRDSLLVDNRMDHKELGRAGEILNRSLSRYCWREDYRHYQDATDLRQMRKLLAQWEADPSWLGGDILQGALVDPFGDFVILACLISQSTRPFQTYQKILLLTAKLILEADGISREDRTFFADLKKRLNTLERKFSNSLPTIPEPSTSGESQAESTAVTPEQIQPETALQQGLQELQTLIGLDSVKAEVTSLTNFLNIRKQRMAQGMPVASQTLHFVFTGNPGTGKTTVARILAKILYGFEILKTSHFIEADRAMMVGGYVGQTAIKTNEVIARATDGVLFIDEAYTLAKKGANDFGQEAIDTLLKKMEDLRERMVVIVAGYPNEMAEFIESNPGLESRFSRYIVFEDYHVPDLCQIFELMCRSNAYELTPAARGNLAIILNRVFADRDENFGNARLVRNAYERTLSNHANRLATSDAVITREALATIEAVDLPYEIAQGFQRPYDLSDSQWRVHCPHCENATTATLPFLGQIVTCNNCQTRFRCPWWNLDRDTVPALSGFELYERESDLKGYDVQAK
ncbi:MAG: AAA family ATPase [Gimesia chilikensis]